MTITNLEVLLSAYSANSVEQLSRNFYEFTDCGAWANADEEGLTIGSIVEGSDAEFVCDKLMYPFEEEEIDRAVEWLEAECDAAWHEANGEWEE